MKSVKVLLLFEFVVGDLLESFVKYFKSLGFVDIALFECSQKIKKKSFPLNYPCFFCLDELESFYNFEDKVLCVDCRKDFFFADFDSLSFLLNFKDNILIYQYSEDMNSSLFRINSKGKASLICSEGVDYDGYKYAGCFLGLYKNLYGCLCGLIYGKEVTRDNYAVVLGGPTLNCNDPQSLKQAQRWVEERKGCLFLDRDGVLVEDVGYPHKIKDFCLRQNIVETILSCSKFSYVIVISNQSGLSRGYFTMRDYVKFTDYMIHKFQDLGVRFDDIFFCPYLKEASQSQFRKDSVLRKPSPGMVLKAMESWPIDISASRMLGDKKTDILELVQLKSELIPIM